MGKLFPHIVPFSTNENPGKKTGFRIIMKYAVIATTVLPI